MMSLEESGGKLKEIDKKQYNSEIKNEEIDYNSIKFLKNQIQEKYARYKESDKETHIFQLNCIDDINVNTYELHGTYKELVDCLNKHEDNEKINKTLMSKLENEIEEFKKIKNQEEKTTEEELEDEYTEIPLVVSEEELNEFELASIETATKVNEGKIVERNNKDDVKNQMNPKKEKVALNEVSGDMLERKKKAMYNDFKKQIKNNKQYSKIYNNESFKPYFNYIERYRDKDISVVEFKKRIQIALNEIKNRAEKESNKSIRQKMKVNSLKNTKVKKSNISVAKKSSVKTKK